MVRSFSCDSRTGHSSWVSAGRGFWQRSETVGEHPWREWSLDAAACRRAATAAASLPSLSSARMNVLSSRKTKQKGILVSVSLVSQGKEVYAITLPVPETTSASSLIILYLARQFEPNLTVIIGI